MAYTETSEVGWFDRIKESIKGLVIGVLFVAIAPCLLICNEKNSVDTAEGIGEMATSLSEVDAAKAADAPEGPPILVTGKAETTETLKDDQFGVETKGALKLDRSVEMYQWVEVKKTKEKKKAGGKKVKETTYSYKKEWKNSLVDSSDFNKNAVKKEKKKPVNPGSMPAEGKDWAAKEVKIGAFVLADNFVSQLSKSEDLEINDETLEKVKADHAKAKKKGNYIYINAFGNGADPADPNVGDTRISWKAVQPAEVTAVGAKSGTKLVAWTASNDTKHSYLRYGKKNAKEMVEAAESQNAMMTWILRLVGIMLLFFGFMALFKPLVVLADVIPFIGNIVGGGTMVVAGGLAVSIGFGSIAIGWIIARPLVGIPLCIISIAAFAGLVFVGIKAKKKKDAAAPAAPAADGDA